MDERRPLSSGARSILEALEVRKSYGPVRALETVTLRVHEGECVALVGESGSGKTTLLRSFNRMVEPDSGRILRRGQDLARLDPVEVRRDTGYVQQEGGLLPHWDVLRNAALVPRLRGMSDPEARARDALELVGLEPDRFAGRLPHELSGGQRLRVALARAVAAHPPIVLLDEPFGALDAITRTDVRRGFSALRARIGVTAVLVTHDLREAFELADRIAVLRDGRLERIDAPEGLRKDPGSSYVSRLLDRAGVGAEDGVGE